MRRTREKWERLSLCFFWCCLRPRAAAKVTALHAQRSLEQRKRGKGVTTPTKRRAKMLQSHLLTSLQGSTLSQHRRRRSASTHQALDVQGEWRTASGTPERVRLGEALIDLRLRVLMGSLAGALRRCEKQKFRLLRARSSASERSATAFSLYAGGHLRLRESGFAQRRGEGCAP